MEQIAHLWQLLHGSILHQALGTTGAQRGSLELCWPGFALLNRCLCGVSSAALAVSFSVPRCRPAPNHVMWVAVCFNIISSIKAPCLHAFYCAHESFLVDVDEPAGNQQQQHQRHPLASSWSNKIQASTTAIVFAVLCPRQSITSQFKGSNG